MSLWGTLVNGAAILLGSAVGLILRRGIAERTQKALLQGIGLVVLLLGLDMALQTGDFMLLLLSIVLGIVVGEAMTQIKLPFFLRHDGEESAWWKALLLSSTVFCAGSMSIMGAMQSGLEGNHSILLTKAVLDGVTAVLLAANLGIGVAASAAVLLLYQGTIALGAGLLGAFLSAEALNEINAVGGVLLLAIGLNLTEMTTIRVNIMLPALLMPVLLLALRGL